ncbi:MAG: chemotaxis protein CheC [Oscillospiraceae bacterium]|nr:chemotaxis protein CheC [Oscillospiraceae bacterium]
MDIGKMSMYEIDTLKEIGNIGASSAATALAKILGKRVSLSLPNVRILEFKNVCHMLGGEEVVVVGILQPMRGDMNGHIMFLLRLNAAHDLADFLLSEMLNVTGDKSRPPEEFDEMEVSALREIGNIMISSYLAAISDLTGLRIIPCVPEMAVDMSGAILSVPAIEFGKIGDYVLYIETVFSQGATKVEGQFFMIPDINSYSVLLDALGVS